MKIIDTEIEDVKIIEPMVYGDHRGFFLESWNQRDFDAAVDARIEFVQDNHSRSQQGILRGLHYQTVNVQGKLVRVTRGEVYDVAVDMRQGSKTLGKWVGVFLSEENRRQFWIPPGFAHGFLVTRGPADFLYKSTDYYNSAAECAVRWNDREINISWPIGTGITPILSERDRIAQSFFDSPKIL